MSVKLPEQFIEECRGYVSQADRHFMAFAMYLADSWEEMGQAFTAEATQAKGWDRDHSRRGHRLWVNQIAAQIGNGEQTIYDYLRIGRNIGKRGLYGGENEAFTVGHWLALLRNAEKDETDMVSLSVIKERLEWAHEIIIEKDAPPSVRDMNKKFREEGVRKEWELCWRNIVRNAKQIMNIKGVVPPRIKQIAEWLLSVADVPSTGGTNQEK